MELKVTHIPVADLEAVTMEALRKCGMSEADARTTTDVLVSTDAMGVLTHGTKALRGYVKRLRGGGLKANAVPEVQSEGPTWAIVNGNSAIGMVTSVFAMKKAIEKAKSIGMAYVGVQNSCHFGAAGYYAVMAAKAGMIGMAMANDYPTMVVPGARKPVLGTNPFSFSVPAGKEDPIFLDIASSAVAGGKVRIFQALNKKVPDTWLVDKEGVPTTDPFMYPQDASLMPFAGHKGYGIALMIETFAGVLSGGAFRWDVKSWIDDDPSWQTNHGAAFLVIDASQILSKNEFEKRVDSMIEDIHQTPPAKGSDHVLLPGEIEWTKQRAAQKDGIALTEDVIESLRGLASDLDMKVSWLAK
jgi:LDH2 family malate/lactate/ureidoglycolate dehydrogenase